MDVFLVVLLLIFSNIIAYFAIKCKVKYLVRLLFNGIALVIAFILMLITGIAELVLGLYIGVAVITMIGIMFHCLTAPVLNAIGKLVSNIKKEMYLPKSYQEIFNDGHRMFFCTLLFTGLKIFMYGMIILVSFRVI